MEPTTIGLIGILVLIVLITLRVHVCGALAIVGFGGLIFLTNLKSSLINISLIPFNTINSYNFAVLPLFMLMGEFVSKSGIAGYAFDSVRAWIGQLRGGIAMATVGACGLFAATCGSSAATVVAMSKIALPEMKRQGYDIKLALGSITAGGTVGVLIPPSVAIVLLGLLTEVSIGRLFIAGIIPGIIEVLVYMVTIYILCTINPQYGPKTTPTSFKTKIVSLKYTWPVIVLFLFVMGGIYTGIFSPTEAGSLGAFGALIIGLAIKGLTRKGFIDSVIDTVRTSGMIFAMIIGGFIFMRFLTLSNIPFVAGDWVAGLGLSRVFFLIIIAFIFYVIGMFFDMYTVVILTTPIFFPMAISMGIDPVWWGIFMVMEIEAGMASPPFGLNIFMMAGASRTDMGIVYKSVLPFFLADIVRLAILIAFPATATWLPSMMM